MHDLCEAPQIPDAVEIGTHQFETICAAQECNTADASLDPNACSALSDGVWTPSTTFTPVDPGRVFFTRFVFRSLLQLFFLLLHLPLLL